MLFADTIVNSAADQTNVTQATGKKLTRHDTQYLSRFFISLTEFRKKLWLIVEKQFY